MEHYKGFWVEADWAPRPEAQLSEWELTNKIAKRGCDAWKNVRYALRDDLVLPPCGPNDVVIRVRAAGLCGSDMRVFELDENGYMEYASQCAFPAVLGHEFTGEIVELGSEVTRFHIGEAVTAENMLWCGKCPPCRSGEMNHCENLGTLGFDRDHPGAFAEYLVVDQRFCFSIEVLSNVYSKEEKFIAGVMIEPLACVYEGMFNASKGIRPGDNVVVFGAGGLGLSAIALAKTCGAAKIIVFEPEEGRRNLAKKIGADYTFDPFDNGFFSTETLMEITNGKGIGLAIEASSSPARNFPLVEKAIRVGGELLCISIAAQYPRIDYMKLVRRKATYTGAYGHAGHNNFEQIINLLESKRIDMRDCVTAQYPLDQIAEAMLASASGSEGKVVIVP